MKGFKMLVILVLLAVGCLSTVTAQVRHISIDSMPFESGALPKITVSITTEQHDLSQLTFYLRQIYQDNIVLEKLDVERRDQDVFVLSGTEKIRDQDAALIVSEYRNAKWLQYSPVGLFPQAVTPSQYQPVAIKTMKSSSVGVSTQATAYASAKTPVSGIPNKPKRCQIPQQPNDTLWQISLRYRKQWGTNVYGAMLAIYQANPSAFYQGKINLLQLGSVLRCPSMEIRSRYQHAAVNKALFDDLVASQHHQPLQVTTAHVATNNSSVTMLSASSSSNVKPINSQQSKSSKLLAAIHETQILPSQLSGKNVAKTGLQADRQDNTCVMDKSPQDTLWRVADRYNRQWNMGVHGAMLAIYDANPNAFAQHKIYLLMSDSRLKCPSSAILKQYQHASKAQMTYEALERTQRQS
ncbi:FimV/HubP family polar landmark protein [Shewanella sp. A14]